MNLRRAIFAIWLLSVTAGSVLADATGDLFESRVRPLLVEKCQKCHGAKKQEGGLRLDSRAAILAGGDRGAAIELGEAAKSLLVRAVRHEEDELRMPPRMKLTPAEIDALATWIESGATWPTGPDPVADGRTPLERLDEIRATHWSFRPVPPYDETLALRDFIDHEVGRTLREKGLDPSPRATPRELLRRVFVDLIGLPPSYDDVARFERDSSPRAFAEIVDELLARPEYGERWGRHWLDVARYADSKGYVDAGERRYPFAWTYRDWVVRALNDDLPFDRFVRLQLAADLSDERRDDGDFAALGFLTVGSRFNLFPHEILDDRIDVTMRGLMGLTVPCARCHDHKYDPVSSADYYALHGVFASAPELSPERQRILTSTAESRAVDEKIRSDLEKAAVRYHDRRRKLHQQIAHEMRAWSGDYLRYLVETDPRHRTLAQPPLRTKRGVLREVSAYAHGAVIRWRRAIAEWGTEHAVFGVWNRLVAEPRSRVGAAASELLANEKASAPINPRLLAALRETKIDSMVDVARVYGSILEETDRRWRELIAKSPRAERFDDAFLEELRAVLYGAESPADFSIEDSEDLYTLNESTDVRSRFAEIERVFLDNAGASPRAFGVADLDRPVEPRVFVRGDARRPRERVRRRLPRLFEDLDAKPFEKGSGRLELARAITDARNPLTVRVIVQRVWTWHFGAPLVKTPSDFGLRSSPPSHPRLLDGLAAWFVANGWSLKKLHREILLSTTWQQSSRDRPDAREVDPENRRLWKMNRQRLGLEVMRDSMLAVTGELELGYRGPAIAQSPGDPSGRRRTMYGFIGRDLLDGLYRVFDFPSPDLSSPERSRTTVPQQTLFLLNSRFLLVRADALARSTRGEGELHVEKAERVRQLFRRILSRDPTDEDLALALAFVESGEKPPVSKPKRIEPTTWRYGYGPFDVGTQRLASFTPFPYFDGSRWQAGERYPSPGPLQWLRLDRAGGHAGPDAAHAAARRWIAPKDGVVSIDGELGHVDEECGDGVLGVILSSRDGAIGSFVAHLGRVPTKREGVRVRAGDTLDFIVDRRQNHFCDEFRWAPIVTLVPANGETRRYDAAENFAGPPGRASAESRGSVWSDLAQVLLQSNEFLFVD